MNYYPHHIGDFNNSTRHLTRVERSVYRDAIELYYDTELPLDSDISKLCRRLICTSEQERDALSVVLSEFFIKGDVGYFHERCDLEIAKYHANTSAKARAGVASAAKRKLNSTHVEHTLNTCATNQEPITNNQEPITNNHKPIKNKTKVKTITPLNAANNFDPVDFLIKRGVSPKIAHDWLKVRNGKRVKPTETAFESVFREIAKAGLSLDDALTVCCTRGWVGFRSEWLINGNNRQFESAKDQKRRETMEILTGNKNGQIIENRGEVIFADGIAIRPTIC